MVDAVCFNVNSLVDSKLEGIVFNVAIPLILVIKNKTQFTIARDMLKKSLRDLSHRHPSFYYSLEVLSTFLDIDYNLLVDLYEYLSEIYVDKVIFSEDVLKALRSRGIKNIVYTRSDPSIDEVKLNSVGIRKYIDALISLPETFGVIRGKTVFEKLANHLIKQGIVSSKEKLVVVSPELEDYLDAHEAGLKVIWFSRRGELRTGNQILNLRELLEFV